MENGEWRNIKNVNKTTFRFGLGGFDIIQEVRRCLFCLTQQ